MLCLLMTWHVSEEEDCSLVFGQIAVRTTRRPV